MPTVNKIIIGMLGACLLLVFYGAFLAFYPFQTLEIKNQPINVLTETLRAGETLVYEAEYCRYTGDTASTYRTFIGPTLEAVPILVTSVKPGCGKVILRLETPKSLLPGKYILKTTTETKVNPLQTDKVSYETEQFEIISDN